MASSYFNPTRTKNLGLRLSQLLCLQFNHRKLSFTFCTIRIYCRKRRAETELSVQVDCVLFNDAAVANWGARSRPYIWKQLDQLILPLSAEFKRNIHLLFQMTVRSLILHRESTEKTWMICQPSVISLYWYLLLNLPCRPLLYFILHFQLRQLRCRNC